MTRLYEVTREECVIRYLIDRNAAEHPNKTFLRNDDGREWTYLQTQRAVINAGAALQKLGVKQGDHVFGWMPNCPEAIFAWYAVNYIGAVYVPTNTAYRGRLLEHAINLSDAKVGLMHADLAPRLSEISLSQLQDVIVFGGETQGDSRLRSHSSHILTEEADSAPLERSIEPWDNIYIIFTSGTTGPSKAVLISYAMTWYQNPEAFPWIKSNDRFLVSGPLFHVATTGFVYLMLEVGGSIAMVESFKTEGFWDVIRRTETTHCVLLGVMIPFLLKEQASPLDRTHTLKTVSTAPWGDQCLTFAKRFGVTMYTAYSMSELPTPIISEANPPKSGTAGKKRPGFDLRIVDENDNEVPTGHVGELVVRSDRPWALNSGYYKNAEATARAWRNGWFHTGDGLKVDEDGYYYFVDRMKDAIRRRGENISSFEVEAVVQEHPAVRECAALAVPNEMSEDEVLICMALQPNMTINFAEFVEFLIPRMAHYMVPRYIRIMSNLPKTPSAKIQKQELRLQGITSDTWDREAAGIIIKRQKIGSK